MSPRILDVDHCPHCKGNLSKPTPRVCPQCGGSLQKRFLTAGCLTSAPPLVLAAWGLWHLVESVVARALQS
jgi:predicted amidophosphoribosyltransferase